MNQLNMTQEKILFKNMTASEKMAVEKNKKYAQYPSGTVFAGFKEDIITAGEKRILCIDEKVYEGGMVIGNTLRYRVLK
jgi:hypothetical protein